MGLTNPFLKLNFVSLSQICQLFALVCLTAVIFKCVTLFVRGRNLHLKFKDFPGPPAHWLLGHAFMAKEGHELEQDMKWSRQYPYAFSQRFGPLYHFLTIHHPDYVKTILSSSEPKEKLAYELIEAASGKGLLVINGPLWMQHRRLLTPGFHYDVLKPYLKVKADAAKTMLDKWESYASTGESFELFAEMTLMTLEVVLKCAFSHKREGSDNSELNMYERAVLKAVSLVNLRIRTFQYHSDIIFHLSKHGRSFRKARNAALQLAEKVIQKRREALKDENEVAQTRNKRYMDFLDILLLARDENDQGLSDREIQAEVETFMFAGHDTTSTALSFVIYCLACNPEHQKRCRDEIMQVLDGKDSLEWEDLNKVPYTTMCIKEALRLYPPVPELSRTITKPMTFIDGRTLPAGLNVGINVFLVHRNADVWENPDVFDPLRFLPENSSKRSPYAYVPFSAGPRNCIGQTFAMNELKEVTAMMLKKYELIEDPTLRPKIVARLVLRSLTGIYIKIKRIDQ